MTTAKNAMTPDFTPFIRLIEFQTRFAMQTSQGMIKLAMLPWSGFPTGFGSICAPMGSVTVKAAVATKAAPVAEPIEAPIAAPIEAAVEAVEPVTEAVKEITEAPVEAVAAVAEAVVEPVAEPVVEPAAKEVIEPSAEPTKVAVEAPVEPEAPAMIKPDVLSAPNGDADDLTALNGVGPKLAEALNAEGVYHFSQIAAWSEANVAWVDDNLAGVRGRASRNGWVAQAAELAK